MRRLPQLFYQHQSVDPIPDTKHQSHKTERHEKRITEKRSRHPIAKTLLGLTVLGVGASVTTAAAVVGGTLAGVRYAKQQRDRRRAPLRDFRGLEATHLYRGRAHRDAHTFTLTTASKTYAIHDPMAIIDHLAREQGIDTPYIDTPYYDVDVCVLARISPKGQYGYLGHLDYTLTIVGRAEGDIELTQ